MNSDARALLAAIVADPADDTVRLAYADCIEEHGNVARAQFIRLQIEAERHHPHSAKHAALTQQAAALFEEHWIDWWTEVCEAVGLTLPEPKPKSRFGRFAGLKGLRTQAGHPYGSGGMIHTYPGGDVPAPPFRVSRTRDFRQAGFEEALFRRGFPEQLDLDSPPTFGHDSLDARLPAVSPVVTLSLRGKLPAGDYQPYGQKLPSLRSLSINNLVNWDPERLCALLQSPSLTKLEWFGYSSSLYPWEREAAERQVLETLRMLPQKQLKRLGIRPWTSRVTEAITSMQSLAGLTSVHVSSSALGTLASLADSLQFAELRDLEFYGPIGRDEFATLRTGRVWSKLRRFVIGVSESDTDPFTTEHLKALLWHAKLPTLEELHLYVVPPEAVSIPVLIQSPLLKQLRHCTFLTVDLDHVPESELHQLPGMFDLDRIETFKFHGPRKGLDALKRQLGDRLRLR
jgi:uncharacterized protein (TIGR02996 family)